MNKSSSKESCLELIVDLNLPVNSNQLWFRGSFQLRGGTSVGAINPQGTEKHYHTTHCFV